MGRKKIKIQPIKEDRNRSVTYLKRKAGLFKKAHELAVLTDSQVAVIVFGHNGKLAEFCSTDIDLLLLRYTEYDGIAEKKGPQHYFGLDKDSDDDNDDETGDPDDANNNNHHNGNNGFGPSDANQDADDDSGSASGPSRSSRLRAGGVKRKAGPGSPRLSAPSGTREAHFNPVTKAQTGAAPSHLSLGLDIKAGNDQLLGAGNSAKQVINAALRQKGQQRSLSASIAALGPADGSMNHDMYGVNAPFSMPFQTGQPAAGSSSSTLSNMPTAPFPNSSYGFTSTAAVQYGASTSHPATTAVSSNPGRAAAIANMSIPMPSNERVPIFVLPATPGMTPGGTVTTPGGRRSSFSDAFLRGYNPAPAPRPTSANALLTPSFLATQQAHFSGLFSSAPTFSFSSHTASPQPPPSMSDASLSAATAAAAFAVKGAMDRSRSLQSSNTLGQTHSTCLDTATLLGPNSDFLDMSRPASTGLERAMPQPTYNQVEYALAPPIEPNAAASPIHIVRPYTASGDFADPNANPHLAPQVSRLTGNGHMRTQNMQSISASPVANQHPTPSSAMFGTPQPTMQPQLGQPESSSAMAAAAASSGPLSVTPVSSTTSSATPDLVGALSEGGLGSQLRRQAAHARTSTSASSMSTDDERLADARTMHTAGIGMSDVSGYGAWFHDQLPTPKAGITTNGVGTATEGLVQPVPVHPGPVLPGMSMNGLEDGGFMLGGVSHS